jgi:hypothetical protein
MDKDTVFLVVAAVVLLLGLWGLPNDGSGRKF